MTTKRLKRPRGPIRLGKLIVDIATGQVGKPDHENVDAAVHKLSNGFSKKAVNRAYSVAIHFINDNTVRIQQACGLPRRGRRGSRPSFGR